MLCSSVVTLHGQSMEKKTAVCFDIQHFKIRLVPRAENSVKNNVSFHCTYFHTVV